MQSEVIISRPDEALPALFDNEIDGYHRGFTFGIFGGQGPKTGTGKTITASAVALDYDDSFSVDRVVFSPADFLRQLALIRGQGSRGKKKCIVCEELQAYASNRMWYSLYNKTVMHTIATMRSLKAGAFFVTPMANMIDSSVLKLLRFGGNTRLVKGEQRSLDGYLRAYEFSTFRDDKEIYRRPLRFYVPELGRVIQVDEFKVFLPDKNFVRELEQKVEAYKASFQEDLQAQADDFREAEKVLHRKSNIFKPKEMASRLLEDEGILKEITARNSLPQGAVAAFYPNLRQQREIAAVHWWVGNLWDALKMQKGAKK